MGVGSTAYELKILQVIQHRLLMLRNRRRRVPKYCIFKF